MSSVRALSKNVLSVDAYAIFYKWRVHQNELLTTFKLNAEKEFVQKRKDCNSYYQSRAEYLQRNTNMNV